MKDIFIKNLYKPSEAFKALKAEGSMKGHNDLSLEEFYAMDYDLKHIVKTELFSDVPNICASWMGDCSWALKHDRYGTFRIPFMFDRKECIALYESTLKKIKENPVIEAFDYLDRVTFEEVRSITATIESIVNATLEGYSKLLDAFTKENVGGLSKTNLGATYNLYSVMVTMCDPFTYGLCHIWSRNFVNDEAIAAKLADTIDKFCSSTEYYKGVSGIGWAIDADVRALEDPSRVETIAETVQKSIKVRIELIELVISELKK